MTESQVTTSLNTDTHTQQESSLYRPPLCELHIYLNIIMMPATSNQLTRDQSQRVYVIIATGRFCCKLFAKNYRKEK